MVAAAACSRMGWFFGLFDFCLQTRATASGESVGQTHKKVRLSDLRKAACRQALRLSRCDSTYLLFTATLFATATMMMPPPHPADDADDSPTHNPYDDGYDSQRDGLYDDDDDVDVDEEEDEEEEEVIEEGTFGA